MSPAGGRDTEVKSAKEEVEGGVVERIDLQSNSRFQYSCDHN